MSQQELNRVLEEWRGTLAVISRNISDLTDLAATPDYICVMSRSSAPAEPEGTPRDKVNRTNARARKWLQSRDELWSCLQSIGSLMDRAEADVERAWPWRRDTAAKVALEMFETARHDIVRDKIPVLERDLLDNVAETSSFTVEQLRDAMRVTFEESKADLLLLSSAENKAAHRLSELRADMLRLGESVMARQASQLLEAYSALVSVDPIKVLEDMDSILAPRIAKAIETALHEEKLKKTASQQYEAAIEALHLVEQAVMEALSSESEMSRLIKGSASVEFDQAVVTDLSNWLERLGRTRDEEKLKAFGIGIENWNQQLGLVKARLEAFHNACKRPVQRLTELASRFEHLKSKRKNRHEPDESATRALAETVEAIDGILAADRASLTDLEEGLACLEGMVAALPHTTQAEAAV